MAHRSNCISVLQFDERRIAWLRVKRHARRIEIEAQESLSPEDEGRAAWSLDDRSLEAALRRFAKRHPLAEDTLVTVLPRHEMTARIVTLPSHDTNELAAMINLSAEEYVPYPLHELVVGHCVLQKLADGHARVLAVFAHRDVVEAHVAALRAAGLEPDEIYVSTACLASSVLAARRSDDERLALINLASNGLEVLVMNGYQLEYSRGVAATLESAPGGRIPEYALEEIADEIRASLAAHRRESAEGLGPERAVICGECGDLSALAEALGERLGLPCAPAPSIESGAALDAAVGAALAAQGRAPLTLSLAPESLVAVRRRRAFLRELTKLSGLAAACLIMALACFGGVVYGRVAYLHELERQMAEIKPRAEALSQKQDRLRELQRRVDRSGNAFELLGRLCELAPSPGMSFTKFSFVRTTGITIDGQAQDVLVVDSLAGAIRELGRSGVPQFVRAQSTLKESAEFGQRYITFKVEIPFGAEEEALGAEEEEPLTAEEPAGE